LGGGVSGSALFYELSYYTDISKIALLEKNHSVFTADEAYFSDFNVERICSHLESIMHLTKVELLKTGQNAQEKLLKKRRNYKVLAKDLATEMDRIVVN